MDLRSECSSNVMIKRFIQLLSTIRSQRSKITNTKIAVEADLRSECSSNVTIKRLIQLLSTIRSQRSRITNTKIAVEANIKYLPAFCLNHKKNRILENLEIISPLFLKRKIRMRSYFAQIVGPTSGDSHSKKLLKESIVPCEKPAQQMKKSEDIKPLTAQTLYLSSLRVPAHCIPRCALYEQNPSCCLRRNQNCTVKFPSILNISI